MKREVSAGGCVFRHNGTKVEWLIIKPRPSAAFPKDCWQLPKGLLEAGETPETAALREVEEETGIKTRIINKIGSSKYVFTLEGRKIFKIVTYYLMEYVSGQPRENSEVEEVLWLPDQAAYNTLTYDKSILKRANEMKSRS